MHALARRSSPGRESQGPLRRPGALARPCSDRSGLRAIPARTRQALCPVPPLCERAENKIVPDMLPAEQVAPRPAVTITGLVMTLVALSASGCGSVSKPVGALTPAARAAATRPAAPNPVVLHLPARGFAVETPHQVALY